MAKRGRKTMSPSDRKVVLGLSVSRGFREMIRLSAKRMGMSVSECIPTLITQAPAQLAKDAREAMRPMILSWLELFHYKQAQKGDHELYLVEVVSRKLQGEIGYVIRAQDGREVDSLMLPILLNCDDQLPKYLDDILSEYIHCSGLQNATLND